MAVNLPTSRVTNTALVGFAPPANAHQAARGTAPAGGLQAKPAFEANSLYEGGNPKPTDIRQGDLGDGYFHAGLGALARQQPDTIKNAIRCDAGTPGRSLSTSRCTRRNSTARRPDQPARR